MTVEYRVIPLPDLPFPDHMLDPVIDQYLREHPDLATVGATTVHRNGMQDSGYVRFMREHLSRPAAGRPWDMSAAWEINSAAVRVAADTGLLMHPFADVGTASRAAIARIGDDVAGCTRRWTIHAPIVRRGPDCDLRLIAGHHWVTALRVFASAEQTTDLVLVLVATE